MQAEDLRRAKRNLKYYSKYFSIYDAAFIYKYILHDCDAIGGNKKYRRWKNFR